MESNEEKLLLGCGSFFTEDSFLLSDYLHRQAERAGNRLFNNKNALLFLRSKIFSSEFEEKEGEKILDRCCPPVLKSMAMGSTAAQKESSESFTGKECSSYVLSELEQQKRDFSSSLKSLASSDSCIECSQCCESKSATEAATRIEITNTGSLHSNLLHCESREAISMTNSEAEDEEGAADGFLTASKHDTEALDLLAIAAMQDNDSDTCDGAGLGPSREAVTPSASQLGASPVHGSTLSPILKKRVIRRAKSAFQKQLPNDATNPRLKFCESITWKENNAPEWSMQDQQRAPLRHKARVPYAKRRKLDDLSLSPLDASAKACTNEDMDLEENCGMDKGQINRCLNDCIKDEFSEVGKDIRFKGEVLQIPSSKLPMFSTEIPEMACRCSENHGNVVDYRKLQISFSRLLDACDAECTNGAHTEDRQPRLAAEACTLNNNHLSLKASKGVSKACTGTDLNRNPSLERDDRADFRIAPSGDIKQSNSILRLKILPIRQPSEELTSHRHVSKMKDSEFVREGQMVTRKRSAQQRKEKESTCTSSMVFSPLMQQTAMQMVDTRTINNDLAMRTKRGRSQVLPTKFSDSVLQPWKSSRRKIRVVR